MWIKNFRASGKFPIPSLRSGREIALWKYDSPSGGNFFHGKKMLAVWDDIFCHRKQIPLLYIYFYLIPAKACRESKISDLWVANQFKIWFESWFESTVIRESRKICESLMIRESKIHNFLFNKRFESTFSLGLSKKIATRFESRIIDSDLGQALIPA